MNTITHHNDPEKQIEIIKEFVTNYFNRSESELKEIFECSESFNIQRGNEFLILVSHPDSIGELLLMIIESLDKEGILKVASIFNQRMIEMLQKDSINGETIQ